MSWRDLMPAAAPPFGGPPYRMLDCSMLFVEFEADRAEIERITPAPLQPAEHNRLIAFITDDAQMSHSFDFHEGGIFQEVVYQGRPAVTTPYIWTSTDTSLLAGRELYGMPKLLCDYGRLTLAANEVHGTLERFGHKMIEAHGVFDRLVDPADIPLAGGLVYVRRIPSPDPAWPHIEQVVWIELENYEISECWAGRGTLQFGVGGSSRMTHLLASPGSSAWYAKGSWDLPHAKILDERRIGGSQAPAPDPGAYAVLLVDGIDDLELYHRYEAEFDRKSFEAHGGEVLVLSEEPDVLEGDWPFRRLVILKFPSTAALNAWYRSPEYVLVRGLREQAARQRMAGFPGLASLSER